MIKLSPFEFARFRRLDFDVAGNSNVSVMQRPIESDTIKMGLIALHLFATAFLQLPCSVVLRDIAIQRAEGGRRQRVRPGLR